MEKECMNCGGSIYFQCRKEAAKYNDRLSSREGASEMLNVSVSSRMPRILQVKYHGAKPDRCEQCIWCRDTKVLTKPIGIGDLTASL